MGKIQAALEARDDPNLVIVGRTSAPQVSSIEEAVVRLSAYEAAGADALFVVGIKTESDLAKVAASVERPLILAHPGEELGDPALLANYNVRICLQPHLPIIAAIRALHDTYSALRSGTRPESLSGPENAVLVDIASHAGAYRKWIKHFL